jgi:hypothetical protein
MSKIVVFIIIMAISLVLGGISSGIYVAVIRNQDSKNDNEVVEKTSVAPVVSFIMITSLLLGLLIFGIYYLATLEIPKPAPPCPKCAKCVISEDDFTNLRRAEKEIVNFQEKANLVPDISVQESCSNKTAGIGAKGCGNFFKSSPQGQNIGGYNDITEPQGIRYIPDKPQRVMSPSKGFMPPRGVEGFNPRNTPMRGGVPPHVEGYNPKF